MQRMYPRCVVDRNSTNIQYLTSYAPGRPTGWIRLRNSPVPRRTSISRSVIRIRKKQRMLSKSNDLLLPGRGENIARIQRSRGRIALTDAERDDLASLYDESIANQFSGDAEVVRLLTRSFSRGESIPEYYRYTSLHVYDWFLAHYRDDPVCASVVSCN
jgi:hypothetical protein